MDNNQRNLLVGAGVGALLAYAIAPRRKTFDFEGKAVLIAGGSRGLGLALAGELLEQGARVAICARDENTLAEARRQLGRPNVMTIACDIVDPNAVASMIGEVSRRFGRIDVLINSAGTIDVGPMENLSLADYHKAMDINFWGPLHTMLAVFPMMQRNGGGRIVNIASIGGL
ncbi:MAG TPA: SDR family oxidoreductase, partial [Bryobacteraceae bacterium]|nr:SDR family oxidoreductase [Bryobacteraceae bacterium]